MADKHLPGKSAEKTAALAMVPQPHGGSLLAGGKPGNVGGSGRPPKALADNLRDIVADGLGVVKDIVHGQPRRRIRVPLAVLLEHAHCPRCRSRLKPRRKDPDIEIDATTSASPRDRLAALDFAAKYSIGQKQQITLISPEVQVRLQRTVSLIAAQATWDSEQLLEALSNVWNDPIEKEELS